MKESYYFSHDSNARHDPKIVALRSVYGYEGYGWYWAILEILREDSTFTFPLTKFQCIALSSELQTNIEMLNKFINDCIEIGLLQMGEGEGYHYIYCIGLSARMRMYLSKKAETRLSVNTRHHGKEKAQEIFKDEMGHINNICNTPNPSYERSTNVVPAYNERSTKKVKENKVKKSKEKEKKLNQKEFYSFKKTKGRFSPPSVCEVQEYCNERKNNISGEAFVDFYQSKDWMIGKNKMKDWKAAVRNWEKFRKNKNLTPAQEKTINSMKELEKDWANG